MSTNKNAQLRYKILDECFSNQYEKFFIDDLVYLCSEKLSEYNGKEKVVSKRTILEDITFMKNVKGYNAPIETIKDQYDQRKVYYRYSDTNFSIFKKELSNSEKESIKELLPILLRLKDVQGLKWVEDITSKVEIILDLSPQNKIIDFQDNTYLKGLDYLHKLYHYILKEKCLEITYKPFHKEEQKIKISPYYLKQYNGRWFLLGQLHSLNKLATLALDRIVSIEVIKESFIKNTINFEEDYFDDIIGVTNYQDKETEEVIIKLSENVIPYVKTKPLHSSQRIIEGNKLKLMVKLNPELKATILFFGKGMTVLKPESLRNEIKEILQEAVNQYYE